MGRLLLIAGVLVVAIAGGPSVDRLRPGVPAAGVAPPGAGPAPRAVAYVAPLPGPLRVLRPFAPPVTPYGPGHVGVDLAAEPGEAVRSAGPGVVTFAGIVAGRGVVVVRHADGIRTEYEPLRTLVRTGAPVRAGQVIGTLTGRHPGCAEPCLHWGARRGTAYLDPLGLLRPLGPVRLLPWPRAG